MKIFYETRNIKDKKTYIRIARHLELTNTRKTHWYHPKHLEVKVLELPKNISSYIIKSASTKNPIPNYFRKEVKDRIAELMIETELVDVKNGKTEPYVIVLEDRRGVDPVLGLDLRHLLLPLSDDDSVVIFIDEVCDRPTKPSLDFGRRSY